MGWIRGLVTVGVVSGIVTGAGTVGGWLGWQHLSAPVIPSEQETDPIRITIAPGSSLRDISQQLEQAGIVRSPPSAGILDAVSGFRAQGRNV